MRAEFHMLTHVCGWTKKQSFQAVGHEKVRGRGGVDEKEIRVDRGSAYMQNKQGWKKQQQQQQQQQDWYT